MVAKKHIGEIFHVIDRYVKREDILKMLRCLADTEAYRRNVSFRMTVDLLIKYEREVLYSDQK